MNDEQKKDYLERMKSAIQKSFTGSSKDGKTTWNTTVNLSWAEDGSEAGENDHIIRIKDADKMPTSKKNPSNKSLPLDGHSKIPSKEISINADILDNRLEEKGIFKKLSDASGLNGKYESTLERTVAHEAGHSGGLYHPEDQMSQSGIYNISQKEYSEYYEGRNLMYQSAPGIRDKAGLFLIPKQIEIMYEINKKD
jgi:hypothetical protein